MENSEQTGVCAIRNLSVAINCDKVVLQQGEININIHTDAIEEFNFIIINGIKFKKVKEEEK